MATGNDSFTKILLHMQGANTSTTFPDSNVGGSAHTWTAAGNTQISTADFKFGSSSGAFDGTGDLLTAPDSADFTLGSGDFTIDFWFNRAGGNGTRRLFCGSSNSAGGGGFSVSVELTAGNVVSAAASPSPGDGTGKVSVTGATAFTAVGWHHVAFVRTGNTLKLFVDGVQEGGDQTFSLAVFDSSNAFGVGCLGELTTLSWFGYMSEFRLSVGTARWTANFTPPTAAYGIDMPSAVGSYALAGKASTQAIGRRSSVATFALTGMAVVFNKTLHHAAAVASFVLSGIASTRAIGRRTSLATYALTGLASTRAIGRRSSVAAFVLSGQAATKTISRITSAAAFVLTGKTSIRAIGRASAKATFILTGMTNLMTRIVAPIRKFKLRPVPFLLQELRSDQPVLSNRRKRD